ncbi:hypothetical protein FB45DRAFT_1020170 [Roridomyces roridus]|uniref:Glutathione S-transferase UstS-like C-terminal domain-containing protein n=1 Tax=Roridomyces roridus TaxID=1738132 RepID=A0AAD7G0N4_9AGAR|nr:hypothetical protein FB45DRAFT_1020170 [Roridomyces roridus]
MSIYTLPVIVDPTRNPRAPQILSNPNNIAEYLEASYLARTEVFVKPLLPIMVPLSHQGLPARSQSHFRLGAPGYASPHSGSGLSLPGPQRKQAWRSVKEQFDFMAMILDKNVGDGDGVVVRGNEVSYADFALCSVLIWIQRVVV